MSGTNDLDTRGVIEQRVAAELAPTQLVVSVVDANSAKFDIVVVSQKFEGVSRINRHRMVNALFRDEMGSGVIHALTLTTKAVSEVAPTDAPKDGVQNPSA